jgi:hypothetical protein
MGCPEFIQAARRQENFTVLSRAGARGAERRKETARQRALLAAARKKIDAAAAEAEHWEFLFALSQTDAIRHAHDTRFAWHPDY